MAHEIKMPKFGETMTEGKINKWLKDVGDKVEKGEPLLEITTDKANLEVESDHSGYLGEIIYKEGETIPIGETVAIIVESENKIGKTEISKESPKNKNKKNIKGQKKIEKNETKLKEKGIGDKAKRLNSSRIKASPAARTKASEYNISLENANTSGNRDFIIAKDVEKLHAKFKKVTPLAKKFLQIEELTAEEIPESYYQQGKITKETVQNYLEENRDINKDKVGSSISEKALELNNIRQITADRMAKSFNEVPHVTHTMKANMQSIIELRKKLNNKIEEKITYNDIMIFAVSRALRNFPKMNAHYKNEKLYLQKNINIGIAVDTEDGLFVPVIKNTEKKGLKEIAIKRKELVEKSRSGNLESKDFEGGTFTLSNLGNFDIDIFTPIINMPEIGILGVGKITKKPCVINDKVVVKPIIWLSLSFDHRGIDGAPAARFLQMVKNMLENPEELLI